MVESIDKNIRDIYVFRFSSYRIAVDFVVECNSYRAVSGYGGSLAIQYRINNEQRESGSFDCSVFEYVFYDPDQLLC